uniref:Uncharacterized protein n=1 Tax=Arundo donax TaxID=35708 RepID=A0A0A9D8J7_ARUDO
MSVNGRLKLRDETSSLSEMEFPALSLGISRPKPEHVLPPSLSLTPRCSAAMNSSTSPNFAPKHPSLMISRPQTSLQAPDLELKISTARQTGSSPRTPFFGTIRVT